MSNATTHAHVRTIERYYEGCNTADAALLASTFSSDVVHYYVDHAPVRGREGLSHYWARVAPKTRAHWSVDHAIVQGNEAVIEWSMRWTPVGSSQEELLRGTEWYRFENGLIKEIRSYHCNHHLAAPENYQLHDFPYAQRGYSNSR